MQFVVLKVVRNFYKTYIVCAPLQEEEVLDNQFHETKVGEFNKKNKIHVD